MKKLGPIIEAYLLLTLIAAASMSPLAYMPFMLMLLLINGYFLIAHPRPGLRLTTTLLSLLLIPCALTSTLGAIPAALVIIPAIPFLDSSIRLYARSRTLPVSTNRRRPTSTAIMLGSALGLSLLISIALTNQALTYACSLLIAYFVILIGFILWRHPAAPFSLSSCRIRVVAGDTATAKISVTATGRLSSLASLNTTLPWIRLSPGVPQLIRHSADYNVTITPPLAGPARPGITVRMTDPWGLIKNTQILKPLDIFVIPRAAYAAWLARKYLEQSTAGTAAVSSRIPIPEKYRGMIKGVEYHSSRMYQPGDRMKDIDWKHSIKFHELITKEFLEGSERTAIIAANLDARDAEQADILAYSLITSALTMAVERIPTALSVYSHSGVVQVTKAENPRYALIRALNLVKAISIHQSSQRYLASPDIPRLGRLISQVGNVESAPAHKLLGLLHAEYDALRQSASNHPAAVALEQVACRVSAPAIIAVLSLSADDNEALAVALYRLKRKGYDYVFLDRPGLKR
jgi:hypothetical protein